METTNTPQTQDDLMPIYVAAKMLGVTAQTLRRWEKEGKIKAYRNSDSKFARRFFKKSEVEALLKINI